ncbi:MAG TPA: helix-turn-helix domain-containing protein [Acidimicrobiales bacterium]|nr:helix-turn-helix domain-containing protein [Acidimicrobiales bacterium]
MHDPAFWAAHPDAFREALAQAGIQIQRAPSHGIGSLLRDVIKLPFTIMGVLAGSVSTLRSLDQPQERLTLTVEEAAKALGISRAFAYEAVRREEIPSIRIGKRVLVPKAALHKRLV